MEIFLIFSKIFKNVKLLFNILNAGISFKESAKVKIIIKLFKKSSLNDENNLLIIYFILKCSLVSEALKIRQLAFKLSIFELSNKFLISSINLLSYSIPLISPNPQVSINLRDKGYVLVEGIS